MAKPPAPALDGRGLLRLARSDRTAAGKAVGELSLDAQVALICEAPVSQRSALLDLTPEPEAVIPRMPEAELCFTVKALGIHDAPWILEYATPEQVVACVDLDAWQGTLPDRAALGSWLDALAETSDDSFLRSVQALDPELVVLYLRERIAVELKANNDDWEQPDGSQTLDGQFYFTPRRKDDDLAAIVSLMRQLFQRDYWKYFRMMQGVIWELDSECEEWALRWRMGRLEDLGFPPWDEAMRVYRYMPPAERSQIPEDAAALDMDAWRLPVWIPGLPAESDNAPLVFRTLARLEERERNAAFFAFVALANKLAVADHMSLSDAESLPQAIEKAAHFASAGLAFVSSANAIDAVETLRRVPLETLFRVGANLDPQAARPT